MWYIYILECSDGSFYTGITNNLLKRIKTHQSGKGSKYVYSRLPIKLIWYEESNNRSSALKREYTIKKLNHNQKQELILSKSNN